MKNNEELRNGLLKILQKHAEEPDDIAGGNGTLTSFRVEHILNDLLKLFQPEIEAAERARTEECAKAIEDYCQFTKLSPTAASGYLRSKFLLKKQRP